MPRAIPLFFVSSFQWSQTLWDEAAFLKLIIFFKKLANCVDSMLFYCFYDALSFISKFFENVLI